MPSPKLSPLEENLFGVPYADVPRLLPGLIVAGALAAVSLWLSEFLGVTLLHFARSPFSSVMVAIVLGLLIGNLVRLPPAATRLLSPGLSFAVKKVLRLGIILLGLRLSLVDVLKLGAVGVPIVILCVAGALLLTTLLSRLLHLPGRLGMLIAAGTSICGVSAIVATGPAIEAKEEEVAYAVAVITLFGIAATLVYPYAAVWLFGGNAVMAGLFLGTSIHDTSQVTGAALVLSEVYALPRALDAATVTKLVRNVFIAAVIPLMALYAQRQTWGAGRGYRGNLVKLLPLFVLGFLALAVVRSFGDLGIASGSAALGVWNAAGWKGVTGAAQDWAINLLTVALAGVGLTTSLRNLQRLGLKPFLVGLGAALAVGVVSYVAITLLGRFVTLG